MLNRLAKCEVGRRCGLIHACEECGKNYQKIQFALHTKEIKKDNKLFEGSKFYYVVIGSKTISTLQNNLNEIKSFQKDFSARKNRKRGVFKFGDFFTRFECSFKSKLGFYPHLNLLFFNVTSTELHSELYQLCEKNGLKFRVYEKENSLDTFKSMLWYILKFNKMDWRKGLAVQVATKSFQEIRYSNSFKFTNLDKFDNEILPLINMSFLKVHPIKSGKEIAIEKKLKEEKKRLTKKKNEAIKKLKRCKCGCGCVVEGRKLYYSDKCKIEFRKLSKLKH